MESKFERLLKYIQKKGRCIISFSGGMDSSLLAWLAKEALGEENLVLIHFKTPATPEEEKKNINRMSKFLNMNVQEVKLNTLKNEEVKDNSKLRCYFCKKDIVKHLIEIARKEKCDCVLEGSNCSDREFYRPGIRALDECSIIHSPFIKYKITKNEIKEFSKREGLPSAGFEPLSCLLTRLPYNEKVTKEILRKIDKMENLIRSFNIKQVRARYSNNIMKIEVLESDISKIIEKRRKILDLAKKLGINNIMLDLRPYKTGIFDEEHKR
jgi:uncharacterized protein